MKMKILKCILVVMLTCTFHRAFADTPLDMLIVINYINAKKVLIPIAIITSGKNGAFDFSFPKQIEIPSSGIFIMKVKSIRKVSSLNNSNSEKNDEEIIEVPFIRSDGPLFKYTIIRKGKSKSNQGGFAVSGRNNSVVNEISKH